MKLHRSTRKIYRKYHNYFAAFFVISILIIWLLGPIALEIIPANAAIAMSFAFVILMLSLVQDYLDRIEPKNSTAVFHDQFNANEYLISYIRSNHIQRAKLIEYDGQSIKPVIIELLRHGTQVDLLLQHPDSTVSSYQRTKLLHQISTKKDDFFEFSELLKISYYKDLASLRGRIFDDRLISIGWYTYDRRVRQDEAEVWGHTNPVLILQANDDGFRELYDLFNTVFNNLQKNSESFRVVEDRLLVDSGKLPPTEPLEN